MSEPQFPVPLAQALIDSSVGTVIVQSFLSGVYTILFVQAIVPLIQDRRRKTYSFVLIALYSTIMINLAAAWQVLRTMVVVHDATRDTMLLPLLAGPEVIPKIANTTGSMAILIADALLVWRCYVIWNQSKFVLAIFSVFLIGEAALIPILLVLNVKLGPEGVSIICLFFFLSSGITVLTTSMIIFRIITVTKNSVRATGPKFQYTIEILIESGALYSVTLLIAGVLLATQGVSNLALAESAAYFNSILPPITGIAPTLIAVRVAPGKPRIGSNTWSQPLSWLNATDDADNLHPENDKSSQRKSISSRTDNGTLEEGLKSSTSSTPGPASDAPCAV